MDEIAIALGAILGLLIPMVFFLRNSLCDLIDTLGKLHCTCEEQNIELTKIRKTLEGNHGDHKS